jgi:hypothetical protein
MGEWVAIVKSVQKIRVSSDGVVGKLQDFSAASDDDEWVNWNKQREGDRKPSAKNNILYELDGA